LYDFASTRLFDQHRVGRHQYTSAEGLKFTPPVEDGRRCLDRAELAERAWVLDRFGRWSDPVASAKVRAAFEGRERRATGAVEGTRNGGTVDDPAAGSEASS
jgi:hypothetical protein